MSLSRSFYLAIGSFSTDQAQWYQQEHSRDPHYPLSRYLWRPLARWVALRIASSGVTPSQVTIANLFFTLLAAASLVLFPQFPWLAGIAVLLAWFADRLDGCLARLTERSSAWGAWLDANVDEFSDLLWHITVGYAASSLLDSPWPWVAVMGFLAGKYLFFYSLHGVTTTPEAPASQQASGKVSGWKQLYHLPGNADVRVHLLAVSLFLASWLPWMLLLELGLVAAYYNFRWILRYPLMYSRLGDG